MEDFIFACQAVLPTFLILLAGFLLKENGLLTESFCIQGDRLCFRFLFPLLVFCNLYQAQEGVAAAVRPTIFAVGIVLISICLGMYWIPKWEKDRRRIGVIIQSLYRGNFMLYGIPFSLKLGGELCAQIAAAMTAVTLPLLNTAGIFLYAYYARGDRFQWKQIGKEIMTNPILWGVCVGIVVQKGGWGVWQPMESAIMDLARIATPLAFLLLGSRFSLRRIGADRSVLAAMLVVKLFLLPVICLGIAIFWLHLPVTEMIPILIFVSAPGAITTYQLALQFDADAKLAGDFIVLSMVVSLLSIFFFVFCLRRLGQI